MVVLYMILLLTYFINCICEVNDSNGNSIDRKEENNGRYYKEYAMKNVSINKFLDILFKISLKQFNKTLDNVLNNYKLSEPETDLIEKEFHLSYLKFQLVVLNRLKKSFEPSKMIEMGQFGLDVIELCNYVLQNILNNNLENVGGELLQLTDWQEQTLKDKIVRQQSKIIMFYTEKNICDIVNLCYGKMYYTEYLTKWLRQLMDASSNNLRTFFLAISEYLDFNVHRLKTTSNFRRNAYNIVKANSMAQREVLDFVDEVITKQNETFESVPTKFKTKAILLAQLSQLLDRNYDMNSENLVILEDIGSNLANWLNKDNIDVNSILTVAVENMQLNIKIWPLNVQAKIEYVWSKIVI